MSEESKRISTKNSISYPSINLRTALDKLESINVSMGHKGMFQREVLVQGMGYSSLNGASGRSVAALVHFGLLNRTGDNYSISDLGKKWLFNTSNDDREHVRREAALMPKLFNQLYNSYAGQALPNLLHNILVTNYGAQPKVSQDIVRIFYETLQYAGLISDNGILKSKVLEEVTENESTSEVSNPEKVENTLLSEVPSKNASENRPILHQEFFLKSGIKVSFPIEMSLRVVMGEFADALRLLDESALKGAVDDIENKQI